MSAQQTSVVHGLPLTDPRCAEVLEALPGLAPVSGLHTPGRYVVSYKYDRPGPAGPFGGRTDTDKKYSKGDSIRAVYGLATVVSCRVAKAEVQS